MNKEQKERLEQLKRTNKEKQQKREIENNALLSECIEALGAAREILGQKEKDAVYHIFNKIPFLPWGIDWELFNTVYEITEIDQLYEKCKTKDFYIIWWSKYPIIKSDIATIIEKMDDVCAVSPETWLLSSDYEEVIEFHHDGKITLGYLERGSQNRSYKAGLNEMMERYLDRIIGVPVTRIGRVANMVWIGFGKNVMTVDRKGRKREKSEYALHIQSPWRIINKKKEEIVMASSDMYSPRTGMGYSEDFKWEPQGNNLFDEKSQNWLKGEMPVYIKKYKINRWGDLTLFFSNDEKLQVFNAASNDTESWRLLMPGSEEPHLVASGGEINFE